MLPAPSILAYDLCVFIGRFEPFHIGHQRVAVQGLALASHMLMVVGSANEARSYRNPFTAPERVAMITEAMVHDPRLTVLALEDSTYAIAEWVDRTTRTVDRLWQDLRSANPALPVVPRIALIGHDKDETTYYLSLFPAWDLVDMPQQAPMSATDVRRQLFGSFQIAFEVLDAQAPEVTPSRLDHKARAARRQAREEAFRSAYHHRALKAAQAFLAHQRLLQNSGNEQLSPPVIDFLARFIGTQDYCDLCAEFAHAGKSRYDWRHAPYAPLFVTADAVVVHQGSVLMVRRNGYPGRGLWAVPGGFVEEDEPIRQSMLRELSEEAAIGLSSKQLAEHVRVSHVFDAPHRSSRGRTITHAYLIELPDEWPRPSVAAGAPGMEEEIQDIAWIPVEKVVRSRCFEDHYAILHALLRISRNPA